MKTVAELEAQNKALWELVCIAENALQYALDIKLPGLAITHGTWAIDAIHKQANIALAAIQKAKESKV